MPLNIRPTPPGHFKINDDASNANYVYDLDKNYIFFALAYPTTWKAAAHT